MSFRTRLTITFGLIVLISLFALAAGVRREVRTRLTNEYQARGRTLAGAIESGLAHSDASIAARLRAVASEAAEDNMLRDALLGRTEDRSYLLGFAERALRIAQLSLLQIRNDSGRILSSGHFRNEFDRIDPALLDALRAAPKGVALVSTPSPSGVVRMLVRADSVRVGGRSFTLVGGMRADEMLFAGAPASGELIVTIAAADRVIASSIDTAGSGADPPAAEALTVARIALPYLDIGGGSSAPVNAEVVITHSLDGLKLLQRRLDRWFAIVLLVTLGGAVLLAWWLSRILTRPLSDLAQASARVGLDRFDVAFATGRTDEIGALSRRLQSMVERLRGNAAQLRDAERRATIGDLARQVNHDIKNGLAPIRNVVRHLAEAARESPSELAGIFGARQGTLESSIGYLETLAQNYARLSPRPGAVGCDVNAVVDEVVRTGSARGAAVLARCTPGVPPIAADPVVLRRILENLVGNAIDSLEVGRGDVTVTSERVLPGPRHGDVVRITVADTGRGMTEAELARAFDDFYTTKPGGTGLGLSVVRRLVADLGGSLRIETEPGTGTRVIVDLPVGRPASPADARGPTLARGAV